MDLLELKVKNRPVYIIDDSKLLGGSKYRAMLPFLKTILKKNKPNYIFFPGAANGLGMLALSLAASELKKDYDIQVHIYTQYYETPIVKLCKTLGSHVHVYKKKFKDIYKIIDEDKKKVSKYNPIEINLGGDNKEFINIFKKELSKVIKKHNIKNSSNTHIWVVYGSGTLYKTLIQILDKAIFHLVEVGKKITYVRKQDKIYESKMGFYQEPEKEFLPPYDTIKSYDAKIWQFLVKNIDKYEGDTYVWNVGKEPDEK
jgi:hypothetical protein